MRITSIDPGFNTGVAIAILKETKKLVTLKKYLLCTVVDEPETVVNLVLASRSQICLMERQPFNTISSPLRPNNQIRAGLGELKVVEITPGTWKPFMRSRFAELEPWASETQHEWDAMALLYYWVQMQNKKLKVQYV